MTTLVTGATGTVGRQVVRELLDRSERVRALTRDPRYLVSNHRGQREAGRGRSRAGQPGRHPLVTAYPPGVLVVE